MPNPLSRIPGSWWHIELAAAVFFAVNGSGPKQAIIATLAKRKLDLARLDLFNALTKLTKARQKERDGLAHWIWGAAANLPDALLLADPRDASDSSNTIFVYTQRHFDAIRRQFERLATLYFKFRLIARRRTNLTRNSKRCLPNC